MLLVDGTKIEIVSVGTQGPRGPIGLSGIVPNIINSPLTVEVGDQMIVYQFMELNSVLTIEGQLVII